VKREMLKQRPKFDEGDLGFSKFTRFLKQAHDEEIVNVRQGEDGTFQIVPLESAGDGRKADRGRRDRKEHRGRREEPEKSPEASRAQPDDDLTEGLAEVVESSPEPGEASRPGTEQAEQAAEPVESTESGPEAAGPSGRGGAERRRGLRQRRGRRGGGKADARPSPESGPSKEPAAEDEAAESAQAALDLEAQPEPKPKPKAEARSEPKTEKRPEPKQAGLSRFRRGGRGGRGRGPNAAPKKAKTAEVETPATPEPETVETPSSPAPEMTEGASAAAFGDVVEHMVRNYKGVGRKTAETLAAELGNDVFDVIDSDPDRIRSILPGRRADAVIAGRAAEGA
jgi:ribonuclease E